jgi:hypothetical protein
MNDAVLGVAALLEFILFQSKVFECHLQRSFLGALAQSFSFPSHRTSSLGRAMEHDGIPEPSRALNSVHNLHTSATQKNFILLNH